MYMKNMQIIANNIAIPSQNRFATEHVIINKYKTFSVLIYM